jgi:monoamine oxidase
MSRSPLFRKLTHTIFAASLCDKNNISDSEGISALELGMSRRRHRRREFLKFALLGGAIGVGSGSFRSVLAAPPTVDAKIAIIGAGLAGLSCGYSLQKQGIQATVYEASNRTGGRCYSLEKFFPGQVAERGGEFIDNLHKTMLGYAQEFNLKLEDVSKEPGEVSYYIDGQSYKESVIVDEYRGFVAAMRDDLRSIGKPTADSFTPSDRTLDFISLKDYLDSRGAGNLIKKVIEAAYIGEYGREIDQQSCLAFLQFIHADKRSKFRPFGVFSDERYHIVGGNQQITEALKNRLGGQIKYGKKLIAASKNSSGKVSLFFDDSSSDTFDAVVFAIPFSTLRTVDLTGLQLPQWKLDAINNLVYGTNSKLMVGFNNRPWAPLGSNGSCYANLPFLQSSWETNFIQATQNRAVLTNYSGGKLGASFKPQELQQNAANFVNNLKLVFPGADTSAARSNNQYLAYLENWSLNPLYKGSYTCNQPGYFTTIANNEGKPVNNLYFAGEHTSSFYEWQGFMEGAAVSGITAANQIFKDFKVKTK